MGRKRRTEKALSQDDPSGWKCQEVVVIKFKLSSLRNGCKLE
jgi:hypothetical protein